MEKEYVPFAVENEGKCMTCEDVKPLDEMIRRFGKKGKYHCIDCEVEVQNDVYFEIPKGTNLLQIQKDDSGKVKRLIAWCFG